MNCVRFGQIGRLKKEKIEEYEALHANPWPAVIQTIRDCNLKSYSIFRKEDQVFAYFEYVGDNFEKDMDKMAEDPQTQLWWTYTKPCFVENEFYVDMKQIFYCD